MRRRPRLALLAVLAAAVVALAGAGCSGDTGDEVSTASSTAPASTTTTAPPGIVTPLEEVAVGQCLEEVADEDAQPFTVAVVNCADPHTFEVYAELTYGSDTPSGRGAPYPGDLAVANRAETQCAGEFEAFMGLPWEASDFEIRTWWPMQQGWDRGDRSILCAVYRVTGGTTVGSVRGTEQ